MAFSDHMSFIVEDKFALFWEISKREVVGEVWIILKNYFGRQDWINMDYGKITGFF